MKKNKLVMMIILIILVLSFNNSVLAEDYDASGSGSYSKPAACQNYRGCWYNSNDMGYRFTFVDSNGAQLAGTRYVDYFTTTAPDQNNINTLVEKYHYDVNNVGIGYANGQRNFYYGGITGIYGGRIDGITLGYAAKAYDTTTTVQTLKNIETKLFEDSLVNDAYPNKGSLKNAYILVEPLYLIGYYNTANEWITSLGTAYDIAYHELQWNRYNNSLGGNLWGLESIFLYNIASNMYLPNNILNYTGVSVTGWIDDTGNIPNTPDNRKNKIDSVATATNGYGKHVAAVRDVTPLQEEITCPIIIDINECGESTIAENTDSTCVIGNSLYLYMESCNLYCTDKIETEFSNFYGTFIGNNKFGAIKSGEYISINQHPKITITKTCYQSATTSECPNWKSSLELKAKSDYTTNNIILNVDGSINSGTINNGNSYTLLGTPSYNIRNNGIVITYEYHLNENTNKYISIEQMKGVTGIINQYTSIIENDGASIITKRSQGISNYFLNLSSTALNRYSNSSNRLTEVIVTSNSDYIFNNSYSVNYKNVDNTTKDNYSSSGNDDSNDLNYSCSYVKYNSEQQCICPTNTVCDPITCEPVIDDTHCDECNSECGCEDNITCDPLPCPVDPLPDIHNECDPETEVCFPPVIYRPISLINPFPGIDGTNRDPGKNWDGIARDQNGSYIGGTVSTLVDYYITNNRGYDDYDLYREAEPLYVIKLNGAKIKAIREYNDYKNHNYNDFDLDCTNGEKCISKFLRGRADRFSINLIDSGTCKNINASTFDSCITRK